MAQSLANAVDLIVVRASWKCEKFGFEIRKLSVIECFETDGGVNYRSDRLIWF